MTKLAIASLKRDLGLFVHSSPKTSPQHSTEVKKATSENIQKEINKKQETSLCYNSGPIFPPEMSTSSPHSQYRHERARKVSGNKRQQK